MGSPGRPRHPETLTPRQQDVLALLRRGLTNEEIAQQLGISLDGVKYHVSEILRRLHVESRHEAAAWQPEPSRPRVAWLLAPLLAVKKLHLGAFGYAAAATITGVAAVGIALLVWGLTRTSGHSQTVPPALARTGIPEVDRAIDLLVQQDVDGLIAISQFHPICTQQTPGSPLMCPPGQGDGGPVNAFPVSSCQIMYATSVDQLRSYFGNDLLRQPSAAPYAVLRDNRPDRTGDGYWIAITQNRPSMATANVSFWNIAVDGHLVAMDTACVPKGAAQEVANRFPNPDFLLGPYINCSPPPGETPNFMVTVDFIDPGGALPQFLGEANSTLGEDTGERAIITVPPGTTWIGEIDRFADIRAGMQLEAVGVRQPDCTILAQTILIPAEQHVTNTFYKVELDVPTSLQGNLALGSSASASDPAHPERKVSFSAAGALSLDAATDALAHHHLKPYGTNPVIEDIALPAGAAKLIIPDPDDAPDSSAALIIRYASPLVIRDQNGSGTYPYFELFAAVSDIRQIAASLRFTQ